MKELYGTVNHYKKVEYRSLTVDHTKSQNGTNGSAHYPVKHLSDGLSSHLLDRLQHLNLDQSLENDRNKIEIYLSTYTI